MEVIIAKDRQVADLSVSGNEKFPLTFAPFTIKNIRFKNKIFFAAMGIDLANHDGSFSEGLQDFYSGIAEGGCGFMMLSNATVSRDSILQPRGLRLFEQAHADAIKGFVNECSALDVVVGIQLQHYGGQATTTYVRGKPLLTPSGIPTKGFKKADPRYKVKEMTIDDINAVKNQFAAAARLAVSAGVKLIQLQASNGYLLSSFLSPNTNKRTDEYGGDNLARARLLIEVVNAVRAEIGNDIILAVRLGVDDCLEPKSDGTVAEDFELIIPLLETAGVDLIEVSMCTHDTFKRFIDEPLFMENYFQEQVKKIRSYSRVPVGFAGFIGSIEKAESLLANNTCDIVGMARALFADNNLIIKTLNGKENEIDQCLWDGKCYKDKANPKYNRVYCCVNPKYKRPD